MAKPKSKAVNHTKHSAAPSPKQGNLFPMSVLKSKKAGTAIDNADVMKAGVPSNTMTTGKNDFTTKTSKHPY